MSSTRTPRASPPASDRPASITGSPASGICATARVRPRRTSRTGSTWRGPSGSFGLPNGSDTTRANGQVHSSSCSRTRSSASGPPSGGSTSRPACGGSGPRITRSRARTARRARSIRWLQLRTDGSVMAISSEAITSSASMADRSLSRGSASTMKVRALRFGSQAGSRSSRMHTTNGSLSGHGSLDDRRAIGIVGRCRRSKRSESRRPSPQALDMISYIASRSPHR